jgi:uncharacterized LabA/DUF88 family protein
MPGSTSPATMYAFVDGAYVRAIANAHGDPPYNPRRLAQKQIQSCGAFGNSFASLARVLYFDAEPDEPVANDLADYWHIVESLEDTHLAFGWIRGKSNRRGPRQKAVDTLLAVEMVSGAYNKRFDVALLIAGDADFVPIVNEVRRAGPHVVVAAATDPTNQSRYNYSTELRRAADRFIELPNIRADPRFESYFKPL